MDDSKQAEQIQQAQQAQGSCSLQEKSCLPENEPTSNSPVYHAGDIEHAELSTVQKFVLGTVLSTTLFLVALEQTVTTASLPQISADLHSSSGYTWIGTAYLLASASVMPIYGKGSDIFGRKPAILVAVAIFIAGSAIAGASKNMGMLIGARAVQGLGGGGVASLINIIISDLVRLHQRGLFMGFIGSTWMLASCFGPLVGGALSEAGHWRWCFYLNLPIGGVAFAVLIVVLKIKSPDVDIMHNLSRIDIVGIVLSVGATCMLLLALDWGGTVYPWDSSIVIGCLVGSGVAYVLFMIYEGFVPQEPLAPPRMFADRTRATCLAASFAHALAFLGVVYYLPFLFQSVYGQSPIMASVYIIPQAVLMGLSSALGGLVISKTGRYVDMMRIGLGLTSVFLGLLSTLNPHSNVARRIIYPALYGIPVGCNFQSFLIGLQTRISRRDIAVATTMQAYIRQLGMSIGIAVGGVAFQDRITTLARQSDNPTLMRLLSGNAPASVNAVKHLPDNLKSIAANYYMEAFQVVFYVFAALAGAGCIITLFIPQNELKMQDQRQETEQTEASEEEPSRSVSIQDPDQSARNEHN